MDDVTMRVYSVVLLCSLDPRQWEVTCLAEDAREAIDAASLQLSKNDQLLRKLKAPRSAEQLLGTFTPLSVEHVVDLTETGQPQGGFVGAGSADDAEDE